MSGRDMPKRAQDANEAAPLSLESIVIVFEKIGIEIPGSMANRILDYIDLLVRWNQKISLTSVTDPLALVERHFGESLFGAISAGIESGNLLDVGSGAGFPALPIAMFRPTVTEILLEPNAKKAAFLSEASQILGLGERISVVRSRFEEFSHATKFNFITSRAVRVTDGFLGHAGKFLRPDGSLVLWIGCENAQALTVKSKWNWNPPARIPGSQQRCVISGTPGETPDNVSRGT